MNRLAFERMRIQGGERVLEVGFGGGDLIEWILSATEADVVGVDLSEAMVKRARRRFSMQLGQGRVQLHVGSADSIPLPAGSIDNACSVNSLYFWPDIPAAMAEFARVLRPRGRLVLCFQTPESVRAWPGHVHGFAAYGADEVTALMEAAGFASVTTETQAARDVGEFVCMSGKIDG